MIEIKAPEWFLKTKEITHANCPSLYKQTLPNKLKYSKLLSFEECRDEVRKYKFISPKQFVENRKPNWPKYPFFTYRHKGWNGWDDFFGREPRPSFVDLKIKIRDCGIKTKKEYRKHRKEEGLNWPSNPERAYKEEWKGRHDFFGTLPFLSFKECQEEVKKYKIKSFLFGCA